MDDTPKVVGQPELGRCPGWRHHPWSSESGSFAITEERRTRWPNSARGTTSVGRRATSGSRASTKRAATGCGIGAGRRTIARAPDRGRRRGRDLRRPSPAPEVGARQALGVAEPAVSGSADEGMLAPHSATSQRETQRALSSPHTEKALGGYRRHGAGDARSQAFRCRGSKLDSGVDFSASNAKSRSENV
jgi:hypothetical protein